MTHRPKEGAASSAPAAVPTVPNQEPVTNAALRIRFDNPPDIATPPNDRRERAKLAAKYARFCGICGQPLEHDDPVWSNYEVGRFMRTVVCLNCGPDTALDPDEKPHYRVGRCTCGRAVLHENLKAETFFCCEQHRWKAANNRRAHRKPPARQICPVCGLSFRPKRASSVYCSPACRQKAYRLRKEARP